jgi:uncharacterized membrane protein
MGGWGEFVGAFGIFLLSHAVPARHPLLWAIVLWAGAHAVPNGDLAHVLLFGGFAVFSLLGMRAIDRRRRRLLGAEAWARLAYRTSFLPGASLAVGRCRPGGPASPWRLAAASLLWLALLLLHERVIGVTPLPSCPKQISHLWTLGKTNFHIGPCPTTVATVVG